MNFIVKLKSNIISLFLIALLGFWLGYFAVEFGYNRQATTYCVSVSSHYEMIDSNFFYNALAKYDDNGTIIGYSYSSVDFNQMFENNDIEIVNENNKVVLTVKAKYFINSEGLVVNADALARFNKVMNKVFKFYNADAIISETQIQNNASGVFLGLICCLLFTIIELIIMAIKPLKKNEPNDLMHPFQKRFWNLSIASLRRMRIFDLCFIAILFALQMICKLIVIPSGFANLGIGITYLIFGLICMLYGPIWGLIIGFFSDILGFFLFPNGSFFYFGYTIQAMLTGFIYGLLFYRKQNSFTRVLIARLIVNIVINTILGSYLWMQVANLSLEGMRDYLFFISLPKNVIFLIPQALLMYGFFKLVKPVVENRYLFN